MVLLYLYKQSNATSKIEIRSGMEEHKSRSARSFCFSHIIIVALFLGSSESWLPAKFALCYLLLVNYSS
jgi:hypothetical protein